MLSVDGRLAFAQPGDVVPDTERPGVLRARTRSLSSEAFDVHTCSIADWSKAEDFQPDLARHGFDVADLSMFEDLQGTLRQVYEAAHITDSDADELRRAFEGATLQLSSGTAVQVQYVAPDGLIMRKGGPNGLDVSAAPMSTRNDHDAAISIHADQDVLGTPLRQVMDGRASELFRHQAPDSQNDDGGLWLLNLWIPLHQITRPLVLADGASIDRPRHQLRYGLPVEGFLDREEDQRVNDIWSFLHHADQSWYFNAEMGASSAYVFDTLSTAHGSFMVPGEDVAEQAYLVLHAAESAIEGGDVAGLTQLLHDAQDLVVPSNSTSALTLAISEMLRLLDEARQDPAGVAGAKAEPWCLAAKQARRSVVRMSVEMRVVASPVGDG